MKPKPKTSKHAPKPPKPSKKLREAAAIVGKLGGRPRKDASASY